MSHPAHAVTILVEALDLPMNRPPEEITAPVAPDVDEIYATDGDPRRYTFGNKFRGSPSPPDGRREPRSDGVAELP